MSECDAPLGPLHGVRVVEFAQLIAGPEAAMLLGDLGADVVKVEPFSGDPGRELQTAAFAGTDVSATFLAYNRDKRSIALDLRIPEGTAIADELIRRAEVVIESFRPGAMERLGLGADSARQRDDRLRVRLAGRLRLRRSRPRSPWRRHGAAGRERPHVDQWTSGRTTGEDRFHDGGRRRRSRRSRGDPRRSPPAARTGRGDHVTISLLDVALQVQAAPFGEFLATGTLPVRVGNSAPMTAPADLMSTRDGEIVLSAYLDAHWRALCDVIERPALVDDGRFATKVDRVRNRTALLETIEAALASGDTADWIGRLQARGLVVGTMKTYGDVVDNNQVRANGIVIGLDGDDGPVRVVGAPYQFAAVPLPVTGGHPPGIGEHTDEILNELGHDQEAIDALHRLAAVSALSRRHS